MITVVGGTYDEYCFEPSYKERYGSGLRACRTINEIASNSVEAFYTFGDESTEKYLKNFSFKSIISPAPFTVSFQYDYPLIEPRIFPRPDMFNKNEFNLEVKGENILYYGLFEGIAKVEGKRVVYDPQSPVGAISFSETGSIAQELVYVINLKEAATIAKTNDVDAIKKYFFDEEKVEGLIIKMGPKGALVIAKNGTECVIPVYKTEKVWPIGSGDVFAATFSYYWFNGESMEESAKKASWNTASYCNYNDYTFSDINSNDKITPLNINHFPTGLIYLAGPFFTFLERWLIEQIRNSLVGMKLNVFSPLHDVGHGVAAEVVHKDLEALERAAVVFAVLDGLDSGTLFEIGYAVKKGIPVIAYVENESSESVKMLEGTGCTLERDLTTAIYKCFWKLAENV